MDSQTNRHFFNIFFLTLTFFSIQFFNVFSNEETFYEQKATSSLNKSNFISYEQINYSDDLEVDTSFDLQKRKIFDIDIINSVNTQNIIVSSISKEIVIISDTYFSNNLITLSNPRAPPLS